MPTIHLPAGSRTQLEPRPAHQHHLRSFAVHAYLGIAVTLVIVTIWCSKPRRRSSTSSSASCGSQPDIKETKALLGRVKLVRPELTGGSHPKRFGQDLVLATPSSMNKLSHLFSSAYTKVPRSSGHLHAMDSHEESQLSDRSDPEATASRGVSKKLQSSSSSKYKADLRPQASYSVSMIGCSTPDQLQKHMPPPKTSTSTEGTTSPDLTSSEEGWGTERLQTQHRQIDGFGMSPAESLSYNDAQMQDDGLHGVSVAEPRLHFTTPPPPFLTPPTLDKTAFAFQNRRPTSAVSVPSGLDESFIHQHDPDYIGHTSSIDIPSSIPAVETAITRRGSYTKSVPAGIPIPNSNSTSSSGPTVPSFSDFPPSSHPPPPPVSQDYQFVGGHMGHRTSVQNETEVRGEIISVFHDDGHGWQRHTQVYGGGVCLTCLGNEGGFYGPNVPLEDRRY